MTEVAISDAITALNEGFYSTPTEAVKAYNVYGPTKVAGDGFTKLTNTTQLHTQSSVRTSYIKLSQATR